MAKPQKVNCKWCGVLIQQTKGLGRSKVKCDECKYYRPVKKEESTCVSCGAVFKQTKGPGAPRVRCKDCKSSYIPKREKPRSCLVCGVVYIGGGKCCSKKCARIRSSKDKCSCGNSKWKHSVVCLECALKARIGRNNKIRQFEYTCQECDSSSKGVKNQKFCSRKCSNRFSSRERQNKMKTCKFVEDVSRGFVIKRDNYKCQICFTYVFETDSHHDPQYPNIDHIVPLSKGGEHSYANVQLTCRSCNCCDKRNN